MMTKEQIEKEIEQRVIGELTPVDTEKLYDSMLAECYSFESVGGIFACTEPHRVLLEMMDPIAYRCVKNDYKDSLREEYDEFDKNFYDKKEVQDIRDEVEAEAQEQGEEEERKREEASCEGETETMGKVVKG